jgi:hypothetical protein
VHRKPDAFFCGQFAYCPGRFKIHLHAIGKLNLHAVKAHLGTACHTLQIPQTARTGGTDADQCSIVLIDDLIDFISNSLQMELLLEDRFAGASLEEHPPAADFRLEA